MLRIKIFETKICNFYLTSVDRVFVCVIVVSNDVFGRKKSNIIEKKFYIFFLWEFEFFTLYFNSNIYVLFLSFLFLFSKSKSNISYKRYKIDLIINDKNKNK